MTRSDLEHALRELSRPGSEAREKVEDVIEELRSRSVRGTGQLIDVVRAEVQRDFSVVVNKSRDDLADLADRVTRLVGVVVRHGDAPAAESTPLLRRRASTCEEAARGQTAGGQPGGNRSENGRRRRPPSDGFWASACLAKSAAAKKVAAEQGRREQGRREQGRREQGRRQEGRGHSEFRSGVSHYDGLEAGCDARKGDGEEDRCQEVGRCQEDGSRDQLDGLLERP